MPSPTAPTYYDNSKGIMPSEFDPFFKWFSPYYDCVDETGSVEAPVGYVMLVEILDEDIARWVNGEIDGDLHLDPDTELTPGWYVTRQDDNGLIWAMTYGSGTMAEEGARADFASAEATYADWCDEEED